MKLSSKYQSIRIKSLVLVFLLSFIGQAWAMPLGCHMLMGPADSSVNELVESLPCHEKLDVAAEPIQLDSKMQLDSKENKHCCDMPDSLLSNLSNTHGHDCSCPDGGCSLVFSLLESTSYENALIPERILNNLQLILPLQINSALFRPPIA